MTTIINNAVTEESAATEITTATATVQSSPQTTTRTAVQASRGMKVIRPVSMTYLALEIDCLLNRKYLGIDYCIIVAAFQILFWEKQMQLKMPPKAREDKRTF